MGIHSRIHPTFIEGCDQCRWASVALSAAATPSRTGATTVAANERTEDRWAKDHPAYRRLRHEGIQPPRREGSAELERRAECAEQVETGMLHVKPRSFDVFHEETGRRVMEPA